MIKKGAITLFLLGFIPVLIDAFFGAEPDMRYFNIHAPLLTLLGSLVLAVMFLVFCAFIEKKSARITFFILSLAVVVGWNISLYWYAFAD